MRERGWQAGKRKKRKLFVVVCYLKLTFINCLFCLFVLFAAAVAACMHTYLSGDREESNGLDNKLNGSRSGKVI